MLKSTTIKIESIPGIGPSTAKKFQKLGIKTVQDLLYHFPFRYEDTSKIIHISELIPSDDAQTIQCEIVSIKNIFTRNRKKLTSAKVKDAGENSIIEVIWFNQHFITRVLKPGSSVLLNGKYDPKTKKLISPQYEVISEHWDPLHLARITPIYPETKGLTSKFIRKTFNHLFSFENVEQIIQDEVETDILSKNQLISLSEAISKLHFPENEEDLRKGRERIAFDELYKILKRVEQQKKIKASYSSHKIPKNIEIIQNYLENLEFEPTNAQRRCINEVIEDMEKDRPMSRMLEGDVGSGKTLVASAVTLNAISNEFQTAILAPTQVLAEQHFKTFKDFLPWLEDEILLITGNTKKQSDKKKKIIIGTHAILHQAYDLFDNLGLVIIDEQHRFGVKQREFLTESIKTKQRKNNFLPHVLSMTATPIPRSLILTLYGDLEISLLDEMPEGRIPVQTFLVPESKRADSYKWVQEEIGRGGQAFVICPLIEESEKLQIKSVKKVYDNLSTKVFPNLKIALLHGKVKPNEKEKILRDFKNKQYDILVSTSVIEVGIDIPEATMMIIEDAERFGLAQLHQFRGRVGRSDKKSYCLLFTNSDQAQERLQFFASTNDGLEIAEYDLQSRGPGEVYGIKQSGIPDLKFANLMDLDLIKRVRESL